jgi:predicted dehydrogenase
VGLHWGLVHLRTLREAGCEVVALAATNIDHARAAADREGVPRAHASAAELDDCDVVVVAVPATAHAGVVEQLPSPAIILEKPLVGLAGDPAAFPRRHDLFVNYAFSFLATAAAAGAAVAELGRPAAADLVVSIDLPLDFSSGQWILEATSHPLSWLVEQFGAPALVAADHRRDQVAMELTLGSVPATVATRIGGRPGIEQHLRLTWAGGADLVLHGAFRPGRPWQYEPVLVGGRPVTDGEWSPTDCWLDAQSASVAAMVEAFRGGPVDPRLFGPERAGGIDAVVQAALGRPSATRS